MARGWFRIVIIKQFSSYIFKSAIFLFVITFLWLQLKIVNVKPYLFVSEKNHYSNLEFYSNYTVVINSDNSPASQSLSILSSTINEINSVQTVHNLDKFGLLGENDVVIVIQVHNRTRYLSALIESLKQAQHINQTLLVFSHDLFDVHINAVIKRIDFAKVIQIFYPNSIQLHPTEFPGHDPNDCPRNIKKEEAVSKGCNNAKHPDLYGHYREAKFTQTKHHWWWKMNHVMDGLHITKKHIGPILLLEEDHYVAPDFLHILQMMEILKVTKCQNCSILCLGTYVKSYNYVISSKRIEITKWFSSWHNMGMVINRALWDQIIKCAKVFCSFDDYNWDWSLQHVSATCLPFPLTAMVAMAPRVFHIGGCGMHHKAKDCRSDQNVHEVKRVLNSSNPDLFPSSLSVQQSFKRSFKAPKENGGWGDIRDHTLCCSQLKNANIDCK